MQLPAPRVRVPVGTTMATALRLLYRVGAQPWSSMGASRVRVPLVGRLTRQELCAAPYAKSAGANSPPLGEDEQDLARGTETTESRKKREKPRTRRAARPHNPFYEPYTPYQVPGKPEWYHDTRPFGGG